MARYIVCGTYMDYVTYLCVDSDTPQQAQIAWEESFKNESTVPIEHWYVGI